MTYKQCFSFTLMTPFIFFIPTTLNAAINCNNSTSIEVCLAIDGSGSINKEDFDFQIKGLADSVIDPTVICTDSTVTLSVVQFSSSARVELHPTLFTDQNVAQSAQTIIKAISKKGGGTDIGDGIDLCLKQINFNSNKQIIGIATDGQSSSGVSEAKAAIAKGVDSINTLGVGNGIDKSQLSDIAHPKPVSNSALDDGFFITTPDYSSFYTAIREMIAGGNGYIPPPATPSPIRSIHEGDKVKLHLPPNKANKDQYVYVEVPSGDVFTMESKNSFIHFNGRDLPTWKGGKNIMDVGIDKSLADGNYLINLLSVPVGQAPLRKSLKIHGELKTVKLHKKPVEKNPSGYMNFEFGCVDQAPIATAKMPITVNSKYRLFSGEVYFTDYGDDGDSIFASISAQYDANSVISANIQMHSRTDDFSEFKLFRTDSFTDSFNSTGQLIVKPDAVFQPAEDGCPIYVNLTILNQKQKSKPIEPTLMDILVK